MTVMSCIVFRPGDLHLMLFPRILCSTQKLERLMHMASREHHTISQFCEENEAAKVCGHGS